MKDHLAGHRPARGLLYMPMLSEDYGGEVRVYESSAADRPCLWLRFTRDSSTPTGLPSGEFAAHLPAEVAWELAEQLRYTLRHHYQGDAMPEVPEELKERVERIITAVRITVPQDRLSEAIADRLAAAGLLADPHTPEWQPGDPLYPAPAPEPEIMTYCSGCNTSFPGELDRCPNGCSWAECTGAIDCPADDHVPGCFGPLSGTKQAGDDTLWLDAPENPYQGQAWGNEECTFGVGCRAANHRAGCRAYGAPPLEDGDVNA